MAETYYSLTNIVKLTDNLIAAMPTTFYNGIMAVRSGLASIPTADVVETAMYEKQYIEREAALQALCEAVHVKDGNIPCRNQLVSCLWTGTRTQEYAEKILAIPAANVVARDCYDRLLAENDELRKERPVVRCRDCKHRDPEDKKCDCGGLEHAHMFPVADEWFCADGERKDGDGE